LLGQCISEDVNRVQQLVPAQHVTRGICEELASTARPDQLIYLCDDIIGNHNVDSHCG